MVTCRACVVYIYIYMRVHIKSTVFKIQRHTLKINMIVSETGYMRRKSTLLITNYWSLIYISPRRVVLRSSTCRCVSAVHSPCMNRWRQSLIRRGSAGVLLSVDSHSVSERSRLKSNFKCKWTFSCINIIRSRDICRCGSVENEYTEATERGYWGWQVRSFRSLPAVVIPPTPLSSVSKFKAHVLSEGYSWD